MSEIVIPDIIALSVCRKACMMRRTNMMHAGWE